ncbi:cell cycle regulatory protein [Pseudohyphozyma bogoriensis]|nr:cell cycle regulatory protein [Pseudohyphozyma bogoriensis]
MDPRMDPRGLDDHRLASASSSHPSRASSSTPASLLSAPSSPSKKRIYYADARFIPNRDSGIDLASSFQLIPDGPSTPNSKGKRKATQPENDAQKDEANKTFNKLLKTELFGPSSVDSPLLGSPSSRAHSSTTSNSLSATPSTPSTKPLFSFSSPSRKRNAIGERERVIGGAQGLDSPTHERYSVSPVRYESQKLLLSPRKPQRQLSKVPFKVLDAPELAWRPLVSLLLGPGFIQDDYYLNLVDWSSKNVLGVGLGSCVYLWSAVTSKVTKLCDLNENNPADSITSISWVEKGAQLAIGTKSGAVQIWDADKCKMIRTMTGHTARVGALAWNDAILSSGSHDRLIYHRDVRIPQHYVTKLAGHRQEVCGLKWNTSENQLASGGNDNKLFVWDKMSEQPLYRFTEHVAAIKAISWNPHQHGILASGGGTADMKIRFWNTLTGSLLSEIDTGSQICNLMWSKNSNELVSTHGFSAGQVQNQICIWTFPSRQQVATLTGHTYRVLYLAMSPDGQVIVTGAGDETLRFWEAFKKRKPEKKGDSSVLNTFAHIR